VLKDSIRIDLAAGASSEFTLIDIPARHAAGRFYRYLNVYEEFEMVAADTLAITVASALTIRKTAFLPDILVELKDLVPDVPEHFPVFFHNDSADAQVLTEFLGTTLPPWITVQNKFSYPVVIASGEIVNFANIVISPPEPNMEKLEGPVYLVYRNASDTSRTGISLYITSMSNPNLLKPCVEFSINGDFGPTKVGETVTKALQIVSNRAYPITLTQPKLSWGDIEGFSFESSSFPMILPSFGTRSVNITFAPATVNPFVKYRYAAGFTLHAEADSSACDPAIVLAGIAYVNGAVEREHEPVALQVIPNPARTSGTVTVIGMHHAFIDVSDVLGHVKASIRGTELAIRGLENGTYIVRAVGTDASGKVRMLSTILTIMH
jgi:hypothetical protein